jgi:hypothetical protein
MQGLSIATSHASHVQVGADGKPDAREVAIAPFKLIAERYTNVPPSASHADFQRLAIAEIAAELICNTANGHGPAACPSRRRTRSSSRNPGTAPVKPRERVCHDVTASVAVHDALGGQLERGCSGLARAATGRWITMRVTGRARALCPTPSNPPEAGTKPPLTCLD